MEPWWGGDLGDVVLRQLLRQEHRPPERILKAGMDPFFALDQLLQGEDVQANLGGRFG